MRGQTNHAVLKAKLQRKLRSSPTDAERRLWLHLRGKQLHGCKFRRQHPFGDYILDFVCMERRLVVEVDGSQHLECVPDVARDAFLCAAGFHVLRFWNNDVLLRTSDVVETIYSALSDQAPMQHHPHPSPPLEGEGDEQAHSRGE